MKALSRVAMSSVSVVTITLGLAACSAPSPNPTATEAPNTSTVITPTESPTPTAAGDSVAWQQECENLMPSNVVYAWNPNYSLDNNASPAAGSSWDIVTQLQGTNCNYVNQSSNNALTISVAQLTDSGVGILENQISGSLPNLGNDPQGGRQYFGTVAGSGVYEMFATNKFWITIAGPDIASADDIAALKQQILQYLPWG